MQVTAEGAQLLTSTDQWIQELVDLRDEEVDVSLGEASTCGLRT